MKKQEPVYIYGIHAFEEALKKSPKAIKHVYFVGKFNSEKMLNKIKELNIPFDRCDEEHLPRGVDRDVVHQGVVALITPSSILQDYKTFIDNLEIKNDTSLVILNEITDPHNVGAIIRNAAAFGVSGVLIPEYRQAQITGAVVKVSVGTVFSLPLVSIVNVNTVIRSLKDKGFWVYGLVSGGDTKINEEDFSKPTVFVLGNEGRGIREKTEELCDFKISIPIDKKVESLNVASSSAIAFYSWKIKKI
jgi:23S rRNA (guanosine2251-2'-O)-methyltransferase